MSYYRLSKYFKEYFGGKVKKISLDAGFTCPNRDGLISSDGCIYCNVSSFNDKRDISLSQQIESVIKSALKKNITKYFLYFQAYSNTYAEIDVLKSIYDIVNKYDNIIGFSIGTRPDVIDVEKLRLINSYTGAYEVWLEYGLQSIHNKTLKFINRGHLFEDFDKAYKLTRQYDKIKICAHVIIGLPGENKKEILQTAKYLRDVKVDGVKIHPLHIVKNTPLADMYSNGQIDLLSKEEFIDIVVDFLHILPSDTIIHRIGADCPRDILIAPEWIYDKSVILNEIDKNLQEKSNG